MRQIWGLEPATSRILRSISNLLINYIRLAPGVPTRMHFTDDYKVQRTIADRETGKPKPIDSLVFWCDRLNGEDVARTFSILSQKLAAHFEPLLPNKEYTHYDFIITQMGEGFLKDWNVQVIRRPETE
ncbi:hypothetical protein ES708_21062 [subsurface metagenome]